MFTNHVTSGASDDLSRATGIARDMVCEYALSNISNVNTFGMGENGVPYSQKTLEKIDVEVENILEEARKYCKEVLESNAEKIKLVANVLVKNGLLLTSEIEELLEEQSEWLLSNVVKVAQKRRLIVRPPLLLLKILENNV